MSALYTRRATENALVNDQLRRDVDSMVDQVRTDPSRLPGTSILEAWTFSQRTSYKIPLAWQKLPTGVHDISETSPDGKATHYKLAVRRSDDILGFIRYDASREELTSRRINAILLLSVVLFTILSFAIGASSASRVISPVLELAQRLRGAHSEKNEPLAPSFADDEVGELATALDSYATRLTQLTERDKAFNADVSHELRTPLTIISSTAELMLGAPELTPKSRERLLRIRRAVSQCTELTETLLLLSRSERAPPDNGVLTNVTQVARQVVEIHRETLSNKPVEMLLIEDAQPDVFMPATVLSVALNNLIGNACRYTQTGTITVRITADGVRVEDSGPGLSVPPEQLFARGVRGVETGKGAGLGLAIVKRLCDLYGWQVSLASREEGGTVAELLYSDRDRARTSRY
ncbi:sensor histidine kinase [Tahibacter amnicola]|uniref:histidine kinase n=1 Tax=Tahibacter amnicola TaxID=2976241 RepID=A0ABY6BFH8_9GAMM|nr:HAMP domain-containing sensor histidine kinase [Tahibacter amnicola]UXI68781.1 HAMP domain-containing histidine kinase [Tahibacter amnicola]